MNIIETHDLTRRYGSNEAVHDLNLAVKEGTVCSLLGPNGAGKSTTIKMLVNLLLPTTGDASVLGVDSRNLGPRQFAQLGYVSENQKLPVWMTVRQLLDYCRPFYPTWDTGLERDLLKQLSLPEGQKLKNLSRGTLMKAALLSSLAYRPKLLILDEPFSGLDPLARDELVKGIIEVSVAGDWTVLVSSHDIEEVERMTDHVALLDGGRLRLSETTDALQARFRKVEVDVPTEAAPGPGGPLPAGWNEFERSGQRVTFVDSAFEEARTRQACLERFPGGSVAARPMTLREIFLTLARTHRSEVKGVAA
ncbi:MAG TPA: ABC transporter ATP-binding protein [Opitutaceae bacterium]